jgi:hypothetical protein
LVNQVFYRQTCSLHKVLETWVCIFHTFITWLRI